MRYDKFLFICIGNRYRSPVAEAVASTVDGVSARSAGLSAVPGQRVGPKVLGWVNWAGSRYGTTLREKLVLHRASSLEADPGPDTLLVVMNDSQRSTVINRLRLVGEEQERVVVLGMEYPERCVGKGSIPDPGFMTDTGKIYATLNLVSDCTLKLVRRMRRA